MAIHALGPFRLDTQEDLLLREGTPVPLGRRAIVLLRTLVERPGALVSKDALIEAAWSGRLVEENNLPVQIAALRRVLGEASGGDRWIETLPGRGYRFIGPIITQVSRSVIGGPPQDDAEPDTAPLPQDHAESRQPPPAGASQGSTLNRLIGPIAPRMRVDANRNREDQTTCPP